MTTINNTNSSDRLLSMPAQAGRAIVEKNALLMCPLLGTNNFVEFCKARALNITRERLLGLERLGLFSPVFRVRMPEEEDADLFWIPIREDNNWFARGWAWDTTEIPARHEIPCDDDQAHEAYYSIFQIEWLWIVLSQMTLDVHLDRFLDQYGSPQNKDEHLIDRWLQHATMIRESFLNHAFRPSVAMLCQYISNRYYPFAQGDQRYIRITQTSYSDAWTCVHAIGWDWEDEARNWNPKSVESFFELSPSKLLHAYNALCLSQSNIDPLENWYSLVQFISIDERKRLKGNALHAHTLREAALMIRSLYRDLYDEELPPPNEVYRTIITHIPELEIRNDTRRYLEFVVNQYGLNPQPKLVLIVEGATEEVVVNRIFEEVFGTSLGKNWIEILVLHGVDNATGSSEDMFRAILRLVDYLHHHQTIAYLILDSENYVVKLKKAARTARSIYGKRKKITRPDYIFVWKESFEFDNFSDTELASALSSASGGRYVFERQQVAQCRHSSAPGSALKSLYKENTGYGLPKRELANILVDCMLSPSSRMLLKNRPILKVLSKVISLVHKNPFPTMQKIWERNQNSKILASKS